MVKGEANTKTGLTFIGFIRNMGICYGWTILLLTVFAAIVTFFPIPESIVPITVFLITVISVFLSGFFAAKNIYSRGWLCGAVSGLVYIVTLFLLGSLVFRSFCLRTDFFVMLIICVLSGAAGGIIGVNVKRT